jgi:hypothetical protein
MAHSANEKQQRHVLGPSACGPAAPNGDEFDLHQYSMDAAVVGITNDLFGA